MDRDDLEQMLDAGLSLAEIGRRVGRHEATVAHWVRKHGLRSAHAPRHAPRGPLSRKTLEAMCDEGLSIAEIAEQLTRSKATVRHWLGKYGLKTSGTAGRRVRADAHEAREAGLTEALLECPRHGRTPHTLESSRYFRCRRCRQEGVVRRRRRAKETLVAELGGRCQLCGYDRCMAALEFHHVDPSSKSFGVARRGAHAIEALRIEVRKCLLLCSNCHAEVESGLSRLPG